MIDEKPLRKVERDNHIAVVYSSGYGTGWYSWNREHPGLMFDPLIVEWVLAGPAGKSWRNVIEDHVANTYPDSHLDCIDRLQVRWLPTGTKFRINEDRGHERIIRVDEDVWHVA